MELLSASWWSALLAIILIDLVLAGDNAIVIALAARSMPAHLQKKAIVWGTVGAILVRCAMTVGLVWLLRVPGLMLAGGLGLIWIARKLLSDQEGGEHSRPGANTFWAAMETIVVFGSALVLNLVQRFPVIVQAGAVVLAFTAARMIVSEPLLVPVFDPPQAVHALARYGTYVAAVTSVLLAGWRARRRQPPASSEQAG